MYEETFSAFLKVICSTETLTIKRPAYFERPDVSVLEDQRLVQVPYADCKAVTPAICNV